MNIELFIITLLLLLVAAEVSYLVVKLPRQINSKKRMIFVDTSVLIDGRIISVAKSGFVGDTLVIPRSVIGELQFLADNADHDKRTRARYGLDVVKDLQEMAEVEVTILQDGSKAEEGVDERLLNLAKKYKGVICTIDYNLNKVGVVEGIVILNVNELAQSLRMAYLPGEKMLLELVQKGQDSHQAVGYLTDGTMVVVEHAYKNIGQSIEIEFIRSLQTAAGKMMFAKPVEHKVIVPAKTPAAIVKKQADKKQPRSPRTPRQREQPQEVVAPAAIAAPTVFHSDERDQRTAERVERPRRQAGGRAPRQPRPENQKPSAGRSQSKKPKTSAQREASLIDLVDQQ